jgi:hypothetical protein
MTFDELAASQSERPFKSLPVVGPAELVELGNIKRDGHSIEGNGVIGCSVEDITTGTKVTAQVNKQLAQACAGLRLLPVGP